MDITNNESPGLFGGLLNFAGTPAGQGLLTAAFSGLAGARRGQPWNNLGRAGVAGLLGYSSAQESELQQARQREQSDWLKTQRDWMTQDRTRADSDRTARDNFLNTAMTPQPVMQPSQAPASVKSSNPYANPDFLLQTAQVNNLPGLDQVPMGIKPVNPLDAVRAKFSPDDAMQLRAMTLPPKPNLQTFKPGETARNMDTGEVVFQAPDKAPEAPSGVREYQFAKDQGYKGSYQDWVLAQRRAGASNVTVRNDVKMGESIAGQVGPMVKDSYTAAQGAVQTADAANRVIQAVDSGKLIAGTMAQGRLSAIQLADTLGIGGKDAFDRIANTRQAVRGLAEMTLQGRKQMSGQGAITESESKLAERAMSGDITMTPGEIKQLANASRRAAQFTYEQHQGQLRNMRARPDLQGMAGFYETAPFPAGGTGSGANEIDYGSLK